MQRKIVIVGSDTRSLINFRFDMMLALRDKGLQVIACAPHDDHFMRAKEILHKDNIRLKGLTIQNTGLNPFADLLGFIDLYRFLRQEKPEYIFSYAIKPVIYGSIAAKLAGVKKIISMISGLGHLYTYQNKKTVCLREVANVLYRMAFFTNKVVLFQNPDDRNLFLSLNLLKDDRAFCVAGSGVNLVKFPETPLPNMEPLKFLFIGRLLEAKGVKEYCQAASMLKLSYPNVEFQILGGFHSNPSKIDRPFLKTILENPAIKYLGEQESSLKAIQQSHIVVLPTYYREGIPKSLLEALSIGRPIITTDVPGCREVINAGKNGIMVPARDVGALVHAMESLIKNPQHLLPMTKESRKFAEQKFDVHKVNQKILALLGLDDNYALQTSDSKRRA